MDNLELVEARIKINIKRGLDQTLIVNVKGDTLKEQITKLEEYAQNAVNEIEEIRQEKVQGVKVSMGENTFFDLFRIFR